MKTFLFSPFHYTHRQMSYRDRVVVSPSVTRSRSRSAEPRRTVRASKNVFFAFRRGLTVRGILLAQVRMTELPQPKIFDRLLPTSLLVLCVFLWGVVVVYNTKWIPGDQDGFFIHQTSFLGDGSSDKTEYLFNLSRNAEVLGLSEFEKNDLVAKIRTTTNYLVLSGTLYALRQLYPPDAADQFGRYVGESRFWATIIIVVAAAIMMFVLFISVKKSYKQWPYCLALFICLAFMLEYIVLSSPKGWRFSEQSSFIAYLGVAAHFMLNPGVEYSLFGAHSRNLFTALLVCCYALRWSGRLPWC